MSRREVIAGVKDVVANLLADLDLTLGLAGCASIGELDRGHLVERECRDDSHA